MTTRTRLRAGLIAGALAALAPLAAIADEPGGIGVKPPPPVTGEQVYRQICQACHMADAKGGAGAATIPALASNPRLAAASYPIMMVARGRGAMPGLSDMLSPAQITAVVGYIRTNFGNNYPKPVSEDEVRRMIPPPAEISH